MEVQDTTRPQITSEKTPVIPSRRKLRSEYCKERRWSSRALAAPAETDFGQDGHD
jgi:hypothetical protein